MAHRLVWSHCISRPVGTPETAFGSGLPIQGCRTFTARQPFCTDTAELHATGKPSGQEVVQRRNNAPAAHQNLWQNQTLVARPGYEQVAFENVTIDREQTSLVKAGLSSDAGSFLLPLTNHPWHLNNTQSYCVRVALPNDRFLVVPCMELVRFYFGSSSELISHLFAPPLTRSKLHHKSFVTRNGFMSLEHAERIPRASAEDIARIVGSDTAWKAAALVSSLQLLGHTNLATFWDWRTWMMLAIAILLAISMF
jgi:hypothetical protein